MVFFIGLACMMAAINNVITGMLPLDNRDEMDSGLLAGLMDTVCYAGSSLAGVLLGVIMEKSAGEGILITIFSFAVVAAVICMIFFLSTRKKKK
jgi:sugar phosphate permease